MVLKDEFIYNSKNMLYVFSQIFEFFIKICSVPLTNADYKRRLQIDRLHM